MHRRRQRPGFVHSFAPEVESVLTDIEALLPSDIAQSQKRFYAIKLFERDDKIADTMSKVPDVESIIKAAEDKLDDDSESIITNERYVYIASIIEGCYVKKNKQSLTISDKIDRIVTNRWLALPIFAVVMWFVYYISVSTVGAFVTDWTNDVLFGEIIPPAIEGFLESIHCCSMAAGSDP